MPDNGQVTFSVEIVYFEFIAQFFHEIEATTSQAEHVFSVLAHLVGDLHNIMLAKQALA